MAQSIRGGNQWIGTGQWDAVGTVRGCTATLISPFAALTASHCVTNGASVSFKLPNGKGSITGTALQHPLFGALKWNSYDYALVRFNQSIFDAPNVDSVGLMPLPVSAETLSAGETVMLYGYGRTGSNCSNRINGQGHWAWATVARVDEDWHYNVDSQSVGLCPGDYGGPLLILRGSTWTVAGVNSWITTGGTNSYAKSTYVAADWIKKNSSAPELPGNTWGNCVYYKNGVGGAYLSVKGNISSLASYAGWNQNISTVWVKKGSRSTLFDYSIYSRELASFDGFSGTNCNEFGCLYDLSHLAANNDASSVKCESDLPKNTWGHCVLYDQYGDGTYLSTQRGYASLPWNNGFWNNRASQIWVKRGHTADLSPSTNYQDNGNRHQVSQRYSGTNGDWCNAYGCLHDLAGTQMENATSSIRCN